jgi:hypothetical protein
MRRLSIAIGLAIVAQGVLPSALWCQSPANPPLSPHDSASALRAVWDQVAAGHGRRATWLWVPNATDTSRAVRFSEAVQGLLASHSILASARLPLGPDTVVFRITSWIRDTVGVVLRVSSTWTERHASGARGNCTRSGNAETVRARMIQGSWRAERIGPVMHGDGFC